MPRSPLMRLQEPHRSCRLSPVHIVWFDQLGEDIMPYRRKLDPAQDLAGATPETLARALLRSRSRPGIKTVVRNEVPVKKVPTDKAGDGVAHLVEGA